MSEESRSDPFSPSFSANVGGKVVVARNVSDAAVLSLAGVILDEETPKRRERFLILSIAELLEDYGLARAANTLRARLATE